MGLELDDQIIEFLMENEIEIDSQLINRLESAKTQNEITLLLHQIKNEVKTETPKTEQPELMNKAESVETLKNPQFQSPEIGCVKIIKSHNKESHKRTVEHFVSYFKARYKSLQQLLQKRNELTSTLSISRVLAKKEKEAISIIGMVSDIQITKNGHYVIQIEDLSGIIKVLINKNRPDLCESAKYLVHDEVIGVVGTINDKMVFANNILFPDIPLTKELKKAPKDEYAAFIGDLHFGAKLFLRKEFERLIKWFNSEIGDEQQRLIASKVNYLFIIGDLVEGVGIYPNQEADLEIPDIYMQYHEFSKYLKMIPERIQIIIAPGNHDAMRLGEPQPKLYHDFAKDLQDMPNVHLVSNPAFVNIASTQKFDGIDLLLYHGYSFPYFADTVEPIRIAGGQKRADLIMQFLLRKRHLAPTHTSNLYIPDPVEDVMVIDKLPDIFVTGHIHRATAKTTHNITLLNCSCWVGTTAYQEKVGLDPQPGKLPLVNLQTREIKIINFFTSGDKE